MTDLKTPLETPYLDGEIKGYKEWIELDPDATKQDEERLHEYEQIKAALKRLGKLERINPREVISKAMEILLKIQSINPNAHSVEYLEDNSLFFTIIKNEYSVYLGQFFDKDPEGIDANSHVTIFKEDKEQNPSVTGPFDVVWNRVIETLKTVL